MSHLEDRVVMITGAAGGFGRLLVRGCVARGARVVAADLDAEGVDETVDGLGEHAARARAVRLDVADLASFRSGVDQAIESFGAVDVLVNNAGTMPLAFWADHERASTDWSRCIDVNIKGVVNGIIAVHDQMIEQGCGHVVNISSIYGNGGVPGSAVYSATKSAVNILSDALRQETQGRIKVTVVKPTGVLGTGLASTVVNREAVAGLVGSNADAYRARVLEWSTGELDSARADPDDIRYWTISPQEVVDQVLFVIDQPWGICISELTVRASGEMYVL